LVYNFTENWRKRNEKIIFENTTEVDFSADKHNFIRWSEQDKDKKQVKCELKAKINIEVNTKPAFSA